MAAKRQRARAVAACAVVVLLGGCSDDLTDLRGFVARVKERPGAPIPPLPEFEPYRGFIYDPANLRRPFQPQTGFAKDSEDGEGAASKLAPDADRPREPLEQYPLDSLEMVGTLSRDGRRRALVQDPTGMIHRLLPGNYLGQNYGRIVSVNPDEILLVEIVRDGQNGWTKRRTSLALNAGE